jgi:CubicO group peptidase (beta-lactamase class C family)
MPFHPQRTDEKTAMLRNVLLASLAIPFLAPIAAAQEAVARKPAPSVAAIDAAMQEFVQQGEISGAVTLVAHDGKLVHFGAAGLANIESGTAMKKGTLFSIASMTKPITATGLMILQDEGKLSVDDKVSKYLPAFANVKLKNGESPRREMTIRDTVTHTAGLAGEQVFAGSLEEAVNEIAQRPLAFEPGTKWQYSPGLNVAGRIIEIVSQQPLEQFVKERIFDPLGMNNTTFFPDEQQQQMIATIYGPGDDKKSLVASENRITNPSKVQAPNPSGGLFSTARDMFRFYQMVLNGGEFRGKRVLSEKAVEQMTSPQTGELETGFTPGNCWGLGWCIVREPQDATGMLAPGTYGHGGAFGTQGWVDPETRTIYVLMIQRTQMGNSDASDIRRTFQQLASDALGS